MSMAGHSGNPKNSGRVFRVLRISGFEICNSKSARKNRNPKIRVRVYPIYPNYHTVHNSLHSTHEDMMDNKSTIIMKTTVHDQTYSSHITINKHSFEAHKS